MAPSTDARNSDVVAVDRDLEAHEDRLVSTVTVRSLVDVPVVVRVTDDVGGWSDATSIRIHPETEPERWTVEDATLVLELQTTPDAPATVVYDLLEATDAAAADPPVVERAQPVEHSADEGAVPRFRDIQTFESESDAAGHDVPTQATGEDITATAEATDADVREALEGIDDTGTDRLEVPDATDPLDLSDPE